MCHELDERSSIGNCRLSEIISRIGAGAFVTEHSKSVDYNVLQICPQENEIREQLNGFMRCLSCEVCAVCAVCALCAVCAVCAPSLRGETLSSSLKLDDCTGYRNSVSISQKTTFFTVIAVKTSNLT
jgi:hypothetical protein